MAEEAKARSGSWIAALSIVVVVGTAAAIAWHYVGGPKNTTLPEVAAREWAAKLQLPYRGAACTMFDSDGDGYVSCVLALDGPDRVYFQGLQCGELGSRLAGGCKPDAKNPDVHLVLELPTKPTDNPKSPAR